MNRSRGRTAAQHALHCGAPGVVVPRTVCAVRDTNPSLVHSLTLKLDSVREKDSSRVRGTHAAVFADVLTQVCHLCHDVA